MPALARPVLMMVTDRRRYGGDGPAAIERVVTAAARAAQAGVDLIQVRERELEGADLLALVNSVRRAAATHGARVLVNDRIDVALASGAAGVHLPGHGLPPSRVRTMAAGGFLIGRSVHSEAEAVEMAQNGSCDYLIFGSIFETPSKMPGHPPAGLAALRRVCAAVPLPVLAIGGITLARAAGIAAAGAAGIAAIGLFAGSGDSGTGDIESMREQVRQLRQAFAESSR